MAENVRKLPLTRSAYEKKNELNLWASLCLDVEHLQFEFQQVFDHTIPCCKEIYGQQLPSEFFIFYCLDDTNSIVISCMGRFYYLFAPWDTTNIAVVSSIPTL